MSEKHKIEHTNPNCNSKPSSEILKFFGKAIYTNPPIFTLKGGSPYWKQRHLSIPYFYKHLYTIEIFFVSEYSILTDFLINVKTNT